MLGQPPRRAWGVGRQVEEVAQIGDYHLREGIDWTGRPLRVVWSAGGAASSPTPSPTAAPEDCLPQPQVVSTPTILHNLHMNADMQHVHDSGTGELVDTQLVELAVEVFSMLADPTRVRIVLVLQGGELPVNTIAAAVDKAPAAVSQHLAKLRL